MTLKETPHIREVVAASAGFKKTREDLVTRILVIRGERVMIDSDLAELYEVTTKALNQAVKRNGSRFPPDFVFRLTAKEKAEVVTNCDHLSRLKYSTSLPHAFTEHGALGTCGRAQSGRQLLSRGFLAI